MSLKDRLTQAQTKVALEVTMMVILVFRFFRRLGSPRLALLSTQRSLAALKQRRSTAFLKKRRKSALKTTC